MKLTLLLLGGCLLLGVALAIRQRRARRWHGQYVQHLKAWYEAEAIGDEPMIRPADLPAVKPLKAERDRRRLFENLRRVK